MPELDLPNSGNEIGLSIGTVCFIDNYGSLNTIRHEVCHCTHEPSITCHDGIIESLMHGTSNKGDRLLKGAVKYMDDYFSFFNNN